MCAQDSNSRFINRESGKIYICPDGYIENYWFNPVDYPGSQLEYLKIINDGEIYVDPNSPHGGVVNTGNDFFNNNPNSTGAFIGNQPISIALPCITDLPPLGTAGLKDEEPNIISIYPNPTDEKLIISGTSTFQKIEIVNYLGAVVLIKDNPNASLEMSLSLQLDEGVYFVRMINENEFVGMQKFIFLK
jgi:hypothetical protein